MSATTSGAGGSEPAHVNETVDPESSQTNQSSDYRSPTANVTSNPQGAKQYPRAFQLNQDVNVYSEREGFIEATVVAWKQMRGTWHYHLIDKKGKALWDGTFTWISEKNIEPLS